MEDRQRGSIEKITNLMIKTMKLKIRGAKRLPCEITDFVLNQVDLLPKHLPKENEN